MWDPYTIYLEVDVGLLYLDDDEHPGHTDGNEEATDHFESPRGEAEAEEVS